MQVHVFAVFMPLILASELEVNMAVFSCFYVLRCVSFLYYLSRI